MLRPWVAVILCLIGPGIWLFGLDNPGIRASAWPIYAGAAIAVPLALSGLWPKPRPRHFLPVLLTLLLAGGSVWFVRFGARTPAATAEWTSVARLPSLTLADQAGAPQELQRLTEGGPTLWVFFRGRW